VPPRKRKPTYPVAATSRPQPGSGRDRQPFVPPSAVSIDLTASAGRPGLAIGDQVTIIGSGLYAGETAVIERFAGSAIPAAVVRTEAGRTRQVRTIDLEPIRRGA